MEEPPPKTAAEAETGGDITVIGEDMLQSILSTLPALSFASAACVCRTWNRISNRVLSRPKISSAISLKSSEQDSAEEVLDKVLSEPIRPHFAIVGIGIGFEIDIIHQLIIEKLGSKTPIITTFPTGIIGADAATNDFKEVSWSAYFDEHNLAANVDRGILLVVGYVPGLKVDAIPLLRSVEKQDVSMVDKFVMDIKEYSASVSGCMDPAGIIMFGDECIAMEPILDIMDNAISTDTVIVGNSSAPFLYQSEKESRNLCHSNEYLSDAVGLVFSRDKDKSKEEGEIQFHVSVASGMAPVDPVFQTASVRRKKSINAGEEGITYLTVRRRGHPDVLDGPALGLFIEELEDHPEYSDLYVGVTKRRKYSTGSEKSRFVTSLVFHSVMDQDGDSLGVIGGGIKSGDYFQFYHPDSSTALSSINTVSENLRNLKLGSNSSGNTSISDNSEIFGGLVFTCCGRGESFLGGPNVDSSLFVENFPGIPLAGVLCNGEIGRGSYPNLVSQGRVASYVRCCQHYFASVYMLLSYSPAPSTSRQD